MLTQHDDERFGSCTLHRECEAVCPKGISVENIAIMNREMLAASRKAR
jgi:succinate dehydrogenase / fumarate reductase iron-sulfur subunit